MAKGFTAFISFIMEWLVSDNTPSFVAKIKVPFIEYWNRAKKISNKAALKFQFQVLMANADSKFAMQ